MPVSLRAALVALAVSVTTAPASADAVVITRAMTASTIMEAFIDGDGIVIDLEVGARDAAALRELIATASSATNLPTQIPREAGLSIRAEGRRLNGTIEELTRRKRVDRDEVTGDPRYYNASLVSNPYSKW